MLIIPGIYQLDKAVWTPWSDWSICNDNIAFTNRTRDCIVSSSIESCKGSNYEVVECYESFAMENEIPLSKGNLVKVFARFNKVFAVSFEVKPTSFLDTYGNVIHLFEDYEDEINGYSMEDLFLIVFYKNNLSIYLNINMKQIILTNSVELVQWSSFKISQTFTYGKYMYSVLLNGKNILSADNPGAREFYYVKVYASYYAVDAQPGFIRNLIIKNGNLAFWTEWTNWSVCNDSFGFMNRTRMCNVLNAASWCVGVNSEIIECYVFWAQWSNWTNCSVGFITRTRVCNTNTTTQCNGNSFEIIGCLDENETMWKVLNIVTLQTHLLIMNLQIYPLFQASLNAKVEFEYFLPAYVSFTAEGIVQRFNNTAGNRMKYSFNGILNSSESFNFNFTAIFNNTQCPIPGVFTLGIPLKVIAVVDNGSPTIFFKSFRKVVNCFGFQKIPIVPDKIKESYGRGIYWDTKSSHIYVCMNQHFPSSKVACYVSSDEGYLWNELDIRIGSILGQHSLSNELYAIHRNQKTFMMFHSVHKKWLSLTNYQFYDTAFNYIDLKMVKNLEGDYDQIYTLGPNQWLGNAQGLFLWFQGNSSWVLRITWRF